MLDKPILARESRKYVLNARVKKRIFFCDKHFLFQSSRRAFEVVNNDFSSTLSLLILEMARGGSSKLSRVLVVHTERAKIYINMYVFSWFIRLSVKTLWRAGKQ